jgi:hypothetical protein
MRTSPQSYELARRWIDECVTQHEHCPNCRAVDRKRQWKGDSVVEGILKPVKAVRWHDHQYAAECYVLHSVESFGRVYLTLIGVVLVWLLSCYQAREEKMTQSHV